MMIMMIMITYDYKPLINEDLLMIDQLILKSSNNIGFFDRKCLYIDLIK